MKKVIIIYILFFLFQNISYSQDCLGNGKRTIIQYEDAITDPPFPINSIDSIFTYINLMTIPTAIANYFQNSDPSINCVDFVATAINRDINSNNYSVYAGFPNKVPANTSSTDYFLEIGISGEGDGYKATIDLKVGNTQETIKEQAIVEFNNGFDPIVIGEQVAAQLGPLNSAITEFENGKRDSGAPYAFEPKVEMKAGRTTLDFNEVTTVTITITDYDGTPLQGRTMTLSVDEGGSLDKYSVTTDGQGQDVVIFTAGSEPKIAVIQGEFSYTEPTGKSKNAIVEPLAISIKKPDNCWYAQGTFETRNYRKNSTSSTLINSTQGFSNEIEKVFFTAWVKEISLPIPIQNTFVMDPHPVQLKIKAQRDEVSNGSEWFFNSAGGFIRRSTGTVHANNHIGTTPKLDLGIGRENYGFGLSDIDADQSGKYIEEEDIWDPAEGHKHNSSSSEPNPTTHFSSHVQGPKWDTTYTTTDRNDEIGESIVDFNKQTFYWKDKVMKLNYQDNYSSTTYKEYEGFTVNDKWNSDTYATVYMYYNAPPTDIKEENTLNFPDEFRIEQNYPNPFNPVTLIQYSLPKAGKVRGEVFDILGRSIKTWEFDRNAGTFAFEFNGRDFPSGIYFYSITAKPYDNAPEFKSIKKMVLLK